MAIFTMLFRKMARNRWLVAGLWIGMVLCVALTSSLPMYRDAILQRMLLKELDKYYEKEGVHPGNLYAGVTLQISTRDKHPETIAWLEAVWRRHSGSAPDIRWLENFKAFQTIRMDLVPEDAATANPEKKRAGSVAMQTGLFDRVRLKDGRLPSPEPVDGVIEAVVTDAALVNLDMIVGNVFVTDDKDVPEPIRIRPVGVIAERDLGDLYWNHGTLRRFETAFIVDERLFAQWIVGRVPVLSARFHATADYTQFELDTAEAFLGVKDRLERELKTVFQYSATVQAPSEAAMTVYREREDRLDALLWSLNVPLFVLIAFYLFLVSRLLVERQKPEIAVLRSRGAGRWQIVAMLSMETLFLAVTAALAGPLAGLWFVRVIGSADQFMSFVHRKALDVELVPEVLLYAGAAALFAFVVNLIPVFGATKASIVDQRRQSARRKERSWWHTLGMDAILIAVSLYGLYVFRRRMDDLLSLGLDSRDLGEDPLLFIVPSLFVLGFGLLLLRLYPWFVRLVYWLGRSRWSPALYSTLLLVGRRSTQYHTLMLFLILTVGTGLFNASAARTLNGNLEEQIWYGQGADIILQQRWVNDAPPAIPGAPAPPAVGPTKVNYLEPPFDVFHTLPGVEHAARVFVKDGAEFVADDARGTIRLMGIDTDDFGYTAWMKDKLNPYPLYEYLNLIAPDPHAVLISRTMADQYGLKPGDEMYVGWSGTGYMTVMVYGVIDYFPTFNPNPGGKDGDKDGRTPMLVVGHLEQIQNDLAIEPYKVWIKLRSNEDREAFYASLEERGIFLESFSDTYVSISESRSDPFRLAMNGVMTLSLILSLAICFIGFLLYWILTLQGRMLQLGIFRAMGISFMQMLGMLSMEQILTTGAGFAIGLASGFAAGRLYVPLFQLAFDPGKIVPPFEIMHYASDTVRLLALTIVMLLAAAAFLGWLLKRMNVYQAVKLGED
jgi:putative ABC transport system permease protein